MKVRDAIRVQAALTRPSKHLAGGARIIVRLSVHRVRGVRDRYEAQIPEHIPAGTTGLSITADFHRRHFADYDLGVRTRRA